MHEQAWMTALVTLITGGVLVAILLAAMRPRGATGNGDRPLTLARRRLPLPLTATILAGGLLAMLPPAVPDAHSLAVHHALRIILIATGVWLLVGLLGLARELVLRRCDLDAADNLEARRLFTRIRVIERLLIVAVCIVGLALILTGFERLRHVGVSLMASAGVIGIIIGFAAQKSIATVLAGLQIAMTQPIRMDDVVIVEGEWGRIEEITLTYVVVRIWDQRRLIVPITYFIDNPFQNWTRTTAEILGTVFVYTDYTVPIEAVREKLGAILEATPLWDRRAWCLQVTNATERTMELRALMSARSSPEAWDLRCHVREALIAWLQQAYPQHLPRTRVELDRQPDASRQE